MIYQLQLPALGQTTSNIVKRITDNAFIPFSLANADYAAFKLAATTGKNADGTAFQLEDASGAVMTASQIQAFIATLP